MVLTTSVNQSTSADIFERAAAGEKVSLVDLNDDQECVLGQGAWAFTDADIWRAWCGLADEDAVRRYGAALAGLRREGHVTARHEAVDGVGGGTEFLLSPALGLVSSARSSAQYLVSTRIPTERRADVTPFGYGIVDDVVGDRGMVVELRYADRHEYQFSSTRRAARGLAAWAHAAVNTAELGRQYSELVIQVYRHRRGDPLEEAAAFLVDPGSQKGGVALFFGRRRLAFDCADREAVAYALEELLVETAAMV